jgi:hypothetical protein
MDTPFGTFSLTGEATQAQAPEFSTVTPFGSFGLGNDRAEAMQMQPFVPAAGQQQGMAWWESLIAYGATRAIDNRFGPVNVAGNTQGGSFAGQNGRTYVNTPTTQGGVPQQRAQVQQKQESPGILIALAAAAFAFM